MSSASDEFRDNVKARVDLAAWIEHDGVRLTGNGNEFKGCCPFHEEKTPSFTVFFKDGSWGYHCFGACGEGGDIFTWVMKRKSLSFPHALKLVANQVGLSVPEPRLYQGPEARAGLSAPPSRPFDPDRFRALEPSGKVASYLCGQRGIPMDILTRYSVGETTADDAYALAYKWLPPGAKNPRFEFCKVVKLARINGKKDEKRDPKGGRNILFGMMAVPPEAKRIVIAEGEIDAMTWAYYGMAAVSVPGGAGYLGWIDVCWDWLQRFTQIHISFDEDSAGRAKLVEIVQRLGICRTDMVRLPEKNEPEKDASETTTPL